MMHKPKDFNLYYNGIYRQFCLAPDMSSARNFDSRVWNAASLVQQWSALSELLDQAGSLNLEGLETNQND